MSASGSDFEFSVSAATQAAEDPLERLKQTLRQVHGATATLQKELGSIGKGMNLRSLRSDLAALRAELNSLKLGDLGSSRMNAGFEGVIKGMTDRAKADLRRFGDTAAQEARAALDQFGRTLTRGGRALNQDQLLNDVIRGRFKPAAGLDELKRQFADLSQVYTNFYDRLGSKRSNTPHLEALSNALVQVKDRMREVADPVQHALGEARKQVRDLGAELAAVVSTSDRKKQNLGARAFERDAVTSVQQGNLTGLSDRELKLAERATGRLKETLRGELESLKAQQAGTTAVTQKNRELERAKTLEAQITAEVERRRTAIKAEADARRQSSAHATKPTMSPQDKADAGWEATFARMNAGGGARMLELQARLLANYTAISAAMRSFSFGAQFVKELDAEMRQLQAISGTTDTAMQGLRQTLIDVSESTKFTAVEVTKAATIMAQAGFSTEQIKGAIKGVTLLASATGSDLAQSVDVATSIVGVFNVRAEEMGAVANQVTAALNLSKLSMEKLATGLQYVGNIAADNNVSFAELTTVLAAMSNAGIKSGSTMGTGLRQMMIDLQSPSDKLIAGLARVGLTMADVDVKSKGIIGVLQTLKDAGFTTADAIKTFEVRAAAAYSAATKFVDGMVDLERQILLSNAAVEANNVQMRSFSNTWAQFTSVFGTFADKAGRGTLMALRDLTAGVSEALSALTRMGEVGKIGDALAAAGFTAAALAVANLLKNLTPVKAVLGGISSGMASTAAAAVTVGKAVKDAGGVAAAFTAALATMRGGLLTTAGAATTFTTVMGGLVAILGRFLVPVGLFLLAENLISGAREADKLSSAVDQTKGRVDELTGRVQKQQEAIQSVSKQMDIYQDRSERLKQNQGELGLAILEAEQKFASLGFTMQGLPQTFEGLMQALGALQGKLAENFTGALEAQFDALGSKIQATQAHIRSLSDAKNLGEMLAANGEKDAYSIRRLGFSTDPGQSYGDRVKDNFKKLLDDPLKQMRAAFAALTGDDATLAKLRPENVRGVDASKIQHDLLRQGVQMLQRGVDTNPNDVTRLIGEVERRIADDRLGNRDTAGLEKLKDALDRLNTGLVNIRADEQSRKNIGEIGLPNARFQETIGPALEQQTRELRSLVGEIERKANATTAVRDKDRVVKENAGAYNEKRQQLLDARAGLTPEQQKVFDRTVGPAMKEIEHTYENLGKGIEEDMARVDRKIQQERTKRLEATLSRLGKFGRSEDPNKGQIEERVRQVKAVGSELMTAELAALKTQLENDKDIAGNPDEIKAALEERRLAIQEKIDHTVESLQGMIEKVEKHAELRSESLRKEIERLNKQSKDDLEQDKFDAEGPVRNMEVLSEGISRRVPYGGGSQAQVDALDLDIRDAQDEADQKKLAALQQRANKLVDLTSQASAAYSNEIAKLEELKAKAEDASLGMKAQEQAALAYDKAMKDHESTATLVNNLSLEYRDILRQIEEQQARVRAQNGETGKSWTDLWRANTQKTLESVGAFKTFEDSVMDLNAAAIKEGSSGLSKMLKDVATGAKSAGDAFRDMATTFISAMLDMSAQMAASEALKMIFGNNKSSPVATPGINGNAGSDTTGSLISAGMNYISSLFFAQGGLVPLKRFDNGGIMGSVPGVDIGRDSVNAKLRPGEFVMRKTAVDAIGADFLAGMNARGAAALAPLNQIPQAPQPQAASPVNTNVWVVSPDQQPAMGPNDVLAVVSKDIATGGSIKKLIKQVAHGTV